MLLLGEFLHDESDLKFLLTGRINEDPVENLSSVIRGKGGVRDNPDSDQCQAALRQVHSCTCLSICFIVSMFLSTGSNTGTSSITELQDTGTSSITELQDTGTSSIIKLQGKR